MLVLILSIVTVVAVFVWWLMAVPKTLPATDTSVAAVDNIYNWLGATLGPNWPNVLAFMVLLLSLILLAISTSPATINNPKLFITLAKFLSIIVVGIVSLITWKWRQEYTSHTIEFAIIILMISLNCYLIYKKD